MYPRSTSPAYPQPLPPNIQPLHAQLPPGQMQSLPAPHRQCYKPLYMYMAPMCMHLSPAPTWANPVFASASRTEMTRLRYVRGTLGWFSKWERTCSEVEQQGTSATGIEPLRIDDDTQPSNQLCSRCQWRSKGSHPLYCKKAPNTK
jgi:hypothetical protein